MTRVSPLVVTATRLVVDLAARPILHHVTLTLDQPGLVALAGPNGAGKSTLLKALAGLVTYRGALQIDGRDVATLSRADRAHRIAYMPQDRTVHWNLPVREIVDLGRLPHRPPYATPRAADHVAVRNALARVDATHLIDRPILALSGGERARVLIARALAQDAPVLLADEPAAGLDPAHQWQLFETLRAVADAGTRVIVAMHDLALMTRFASAIVLLHEGRLAASGPTHDVLDAARVQRVYGVTTQRIDDQLIVTGRVRAD